MKNAWHLRLAAGTVAIAVVGGIGAYAATHTTAETAAAWDAAWSAAPQLPSIGFEPNWAQTGFDNQTVRQVVRVTDGGTAARITLSNLYGNGPLRIDHATIARTAQGAGVESNTLRDLTFQGDTVAKIPAGQALTSDTAGLQLAPLESVTVTLYLAGPTGPATFHSQAYASTYRTGGNHVADPAASSFTEATHSWYYLTDIQVSGPSAHHGGTVVAFGDSITDGFGSTNDANTRYPDRLFQRLTDAGTPRPVLNEGIGGNLILNDSQWFGESAVKRFERDVLSKPDVDSVIVLGGLNDIGFSEIDLPTYKPNPQVSVAQLIAGHRELIAAAHRAGVKITGATLLPMKGAEYYDDTSAAKIRDLNTWMRTSGEYDAVVDFNAAVADPSDSEKLNPAFDSGDHKHPNNAGYQAMADRIDLGKL
ncbi:SGNH/GDSL hydrolase family protein [Nocardia sp. NBC_01327]|uniref:SGNH/GDSL hydrolase family protein n=1 Tax=Nocardia sp. NBC_01327 TaxID=2903593 RepID=UPI002E1017B7|nr:SGNH/GDSL hydrolase family protein [Nocardia sp. NBC_01327]